MTTKTIDSTQLGTLEAAAAASRDYRAAGLGRTAANDRAHRPPRIGVAASRTVTAPHDSDVVALVPTSEPTRALIAEHGFYGRVTSLGQRIGLDATYIAYVADGVVPAAYPISERVLVGSHYSIAPAGLTWVADRGWREELDEAAHLFRLDRHSRIPLNLPTGFAPGPRGQTTGLPGVLHRRLSDLQHASALKGLPNA